MYTHLSYGGSAHSTGSFSTAEPFDRLSVAPFVTGHCSTVYSQWCVVLHRCVGVPEIHNTALPHPSW